MLLTNLRAGSEGAEVEGEECLDEIGVVGHGTGEKDEGGVRETL